MQGTPSISHIDRMQLYSIVFQIRYSPPLKLLQKDLEAHIVLRELSTLEEIDENIISAIEGYLCKMYANKGICKVSAIGEHMLLKRYEKIKPEGRLNFVKKIL